MKRKETFGDFLKKLTKYNGVLEIGIEGNGYTTYIACPCRAGRIHDGLYADCKDMLVIGVSVDRSRNWLVLELG